MKRLQMLTIAVAFSVTAMMTTGSVAAQQNPDLTPYLIADRAAEIALARTAAPKSISDSATVMVITRKGLVEAVHGSNGFTCLVLRSFSGGLEDPNFWNPRGRAPECLNPPAVKTVLPELVRRVEWIMAGVSPKEIGERTRRGYAAHDFPLPAPGAMTYMLSPQQHLSDENPHWMPHLMFHYDAAMPPSIWGAGGMTAPVVNGSVGDPHSPVLTLFIPVPQWSDGSPAPPHSGH